MRVRVEVCVTSVAEAVAAAQAGADSVEVCTCLAVGGLTPGPGLVSLVRERLKGTSTRSRVLVRPSPGGFHHTVDERQIILRDALLLAVADDTAGIVAGALRAEGLADMELMELVRATLNGRELTFHRAIDQAADMLAVLDQCIVFGAGRVLTSGGAPRAQDGAPVLKRMVERAGEKLVVAAGGGVNPANVVELVERTGVPEVHFSAQRRVPATASGTSMGESFMVEPDAAKIDGVMNALVKAGLR